MVTRILWAMYGYTRVCHTTHDVGFNSRWPLFAHPPHAYPTTGVMAYTQSWVEYRT